MPVLAHCPTPHHCQHITGRTPHCARTACFLVTCPSRYIRKSINPIMLSARVSFCNIASIDLLLFTLMSMSSLSSHFYVGDVFLPSLFSTPFMRVICPFDILVLHVFLNDIPQYERNFKNFGPGVEFTIVTLCR